MLLKKINIFPYIYNIVQIFNGKQFRGWGRKRTGRFASLCHNVFGGKLTLSEDGFIRSIGLGSDRWEAFSIVKDDVGIYYDATRPSRLENIFNTYNFGNDAKCMETAKRAIELIKAYKISKYNHVYAKLPDYLESPARKVLIVAQTAGDASLCYGMTKQFDAKEMIVCAIEENRDCEVYVKIHPDVLSGRKASSIDIDFAGKHCRIIDEEINPVVLMEAFDKVYTQTSQMGFEALLLGKKVVCFGMPFYAGWGLTDDRVFCKRRKRQLSMEEIFAGAYILYSEYYNPYGKKECDIIETIEMIQRYRSLYQDNNGKLYFFGFSRWKQRSIKFFFKPLQRNQCFFCNSLKCAAEKRIDKDSKVFIWGKKDFSEVVIYAKKNNLPMYRIEDGFVRSVSLGSDLTRPYSLVVDRRGIYFDPTTVSDLEYILQNLEFDEVLLERAKWVQNYLVENNISKYNIEGDKEVLLPTLKPKQIVALVIGQVEDDASIVYGGDGMTNFELLRKVREIKPDAYIIYKPHPDVQAGNRRGKVSKGMIEKYADIMIKDVSLPALLHQCNEVHTITSLSGFEGMLRSKEVYTYGMPFYAGWGLTIDARKYARRTKKITLLQMIAAVYIVYPRYIDPKTGCFCEAEVLFEAVEKEKRRYNSDLSYRWYFYTRNWITRKIRLAMRVVLGES
ncbi:capsular polysaccharide biosynthesis protein [Sulfurovum sp. NBC37-1]|uniref:capsular polysaccharide biosynthesis protein n=1 Tax=Sulfurovum sp. (strain NBC37-1) TaxID=387093 RepID=UPI0001587954|nr:capsular polysaccharide biosynthesis protein [Sulfurovum sp. NBC37-1]BAF72662.1 capsule polysaccharide export protein [Sulfurovum sp. NBC37-1]